MCQPELQLSGGRGLPHFTICCLGKPHQNEITHPGQILKCVDLFIDWYITCTQTLFVFQAKGKERQWLKNQALGELDDAKIIDGLTGEKAIYKRRGELDPEVCVCVLLQTFNPHLNYFFFPEPHLQTHTHSQTHTHHFDLYLSDDTFQWCV